jgi:hypothetical protein
MVKKKSHKCEVRVKFTLSFFFYLFVDPAFRDARQINFLTRSARMKSSKQDAHRSVFSGVLRAKSPGDPVLQPRQRLQLASALLPADCFESRALSVVSYLNAALSSRKADLDLSRCSLKLCDLVPLRHFLTYSKVAVRRLDLRQNCLTLEFITELFKIVKDLPSVAEVLLDEPTSPRIADVVKLISRHLHESEANILRQSVQLKDRRTASRLKQAARSFAHKRDELCSLETFQRRTLVDEYSLFRDEQLSYHTTVLNRLSMLLKRETLRRSRATQRETVVLEESLWRARLASVEFESLLNLSEAQCHIQRRIIAESQNSSRSAIKTSEKNGWVEARRHEKRRYANEAACREELSWLEGNEREARKSEEASARSLLVTFENAEKKAAKGAEATRIDRIQREEALRRRLEDLARERVEKEEAARQKLFRECLLKQHQAREKLESDSLSARKSVRQVENAIFNFIQRIGVVLFQYLALRQQLLLAGELYESKVLRAVPCACFNVKQKLICCFTVDQSDPLALFPEIGVSDEECDLPFTFAMSDGWDARSRELQNDYLTRLQKTDSLGCLLRSKYVEELRILKTVVSQHRHEQRLRAMPGRLSISADLSSLDSSSVNEDMDFLLYCFGSGHSYFCSDLRTFILGSGSETTTTEPSVKAIKQLKLTPSSGFLRISLDDSAAKVINETLVCDTKFLNNFSTIFHDGSSEIQELKRVAALQKVSQEAEADPVKAQIPKTMIRASPLQVEMAIQRHKPEYNVRLLHARQPWIYNRDLVRSIEELSRVPRLDPEPITEEAEKKLRLTSIREISVLLTHCRVESNLSVLLSQLMASIRYFASCPTEHSGGWLRNIRFDFHAVVDSCCASNGFSDWFNVRRRLFGSTPEASLPAFSSVRASHVIRVASILEHRSVPLWYPVVALTAQDCPTLESPHPQLPECFPGFACSGGPPTLVFDHTDEPTRLSRDEELPYTGYELHLSIRSRDESLPQQRLQFFFLAQRDFIYLAAGDGGKICLVLSAHDQTSIVADVELGFLQQYGTGLAPIQKSGKRGSLSRASISQYSEDVPRDHIILRFVGDRCTAALINEVVQRVRLGVNNASVFTGSFIRQTFECTCFLVPPPISAQNVQILSQFANGSRLLLDPFALVLPPADATIATGAIELVIPRSGRMCGSRTGAVFLPSSACSTQPTDIRGLSARTALSGVISIENKEPLTRRCLLSDDPSRWIAAPFERLHWGTVDPRDSLIEALHDVDAEIEMTVFLSAQQQTDAGDQQAGPASPQQSPRVDSANAGTAFVNASVVKIDGIPLFTVDASVSRLELNIQVFQKHFWDEVNSSSSFFDDQTHVPLAQITATPGSLSLLVTLAPIIKRLHRHVRENFTVRFLYLSLLEKLLQSVWISAPVEDDLLPEISVKISATAMLPPPVDAAQTSKPARGKVKDVPFSTTLFGRQRVSATTKQTPALIGSSKRASVLVTTASEVAPHTMKAFPLPAKHGLPELLTGRIMLFPFASQLKLISEMVHQVLHFRHHWRIHEENSLSAVIQIALTAPCQATHKVALIDGQLRPTLDAFPTTTSASDGIAVDHLVTHDRGSTVQPTRGMNLTSPRKRDTSGAALLTQDATLEFPVDQLLTLLAESTDTGLEVDKERVVDFIISCCSRLVLIVTPNTAKEAHSVTLRVGYSDPAIRVSGSHSVSWVGVDERVFLPSMTKGAARDFTASMIDAVAFSAPSGTVKGKCSLVFSIPQSAADARPEIFLPSLIPQPSPELFFSAPESGRVKLLRRTYPQKDLRDPRDLQVAVLTLEEDFGISFTFDAESENTSEHISAALNTLSNVIAPIGACWILESQLGDEEAYHERAAAREAAQSSVNGVCSYLPSLPCAVAKSSGDSRFQHLRWEEDRMIHLPFSPIDLAATVFRRQGPEKPLPWGTIVHVAGAVELVDTLQLTRFEGLPRANLFFKSVLVMHVTYDAEKDDTHHLEVPLQLLLVLVMNELGVSWPFK